MEEQQIDINNGTIDELIAVKGIGPQLAEQIVKERPYEKMNDLVRVSGINEVKLASLLPYLSIGKKTKNAIKAEQTHFAQSKPKDQSFTKTGDTEAFIFLENRNDRQDALLIILAGFIFGLLLLFLRRSKS